MHEVSANHCAEAGLLVSCALSTPLPDLLGAKGSPSVHSSAAPPIPYFCRGPGLAMHHHLQPTAEPHGPDMGYEGPLVPAIPGSCHPRLLHPKLGTSPGAAFSPCHTTPVREKTPILRAL